MNPFLRTLFKPSERTIPRNGMGNGAESVLATVPPPALQGDIAAIAIENIFQLIDFAALTGKLEIESTVNSGTFYFRKGMLIHGLLRVNHRRIGQILLDARLITADQLEECLRIHEQADTRKRFGQILVDKGYAQSEWLEKSLVHQIKESFFEALSWQDGSFVFHPGQAPPPEEIQTYSRIDRLLLEGMVHIDQAALVR